MANSLEVLQGSISEVKKKYQVLTDIIKQYNGKTHGSESHFIANNMLLVVYYGVLEDKKEEVRGDRRTIFLQSILVNTYSSHIPATATFLNKCGDMINVSSYFIIRDGGSELNNLLLTASL